MSASSSFFRSSETDEANSEVHVEDCKVGGDLLDKEEEGESCSEDFVLIRKIKERCDQNRSY